MKFVALQCPNCHAALKVKEDNVFKLNGGAFIIKSSAPKYTCEGCGTEFVAEQEYQPHSSSGTNVAVAGNGSVIVQGNGNAVASGGGIAIGGSHGGNIVVGGNLKARNVVSGTSIVHRGDFEGDIVL